MSVVRDRLAAQRPQLRALTGLRFVAALEVLVFHATSWQSWRVWAPLRNVAGAGYVAVSLFFVLSGFVLTYAHARPGAPALDRRSFYAGRFARIYPAYLFALGLIAPWFVVHTARTQGAASLVAQASAVLLLVQAHVPSLAMAWNPPAWSLSAEAFFYALFPFVAPRLVACRRSTALGVAIACYGLSVAMPLAYVHFAPGAAAATPHASAFWLNALRYGPLVRFPEFVIGVVAGRLFLDARAARGSTATALLSVAATAVFVVTLALSPAIPYPLLHNGLLAPVFALLIASLAADGGLVAALLATRPLVALGDASYSLYILTTPLIVVWRKALARFAAGKPWVHSPASTAAFLAFAIASSLLCTRYVERPSRELVLAALGRPRQAPATSPSR